MAHPGGLCAIAGIGETAYTRFSERSGRSLGLEAIQNALADAGMAGREIDGIVVEGLLGARFLPIDDAASNLGVRRLFSAEVGLAGAGTAGSVLAATAAIQAGMASAVLVYYVGQFGSIARSVYNLHEEEWPAKLSFEVPYGFYAQATYFAAMANRYRHECGLTDEQLNSLLGTIAVTTRQHAVLNGKGQLREPLTFEDYDRNPVISDPLRKADCCLNTDGAAAVIVTSLERARDCPHPPVPLLGGGFACVPLSGASALTQGPDYPWGQNDRWAMQQALERAGVTVEDLDFAQIYDCFTISVALELEGLGFCERGEAASFVQGGTLGLGGRLPINTNGGQLAHSYLVGMSQIVEAARQLRGEAGPTQVKDATLGLVGGQGGHEYCALILGKN